MDPKLALLVQLWPIFSSWRWSQSKTGLQFKLKRLSHWTCSESKSKKRSMSKMFCWRHFIPLVTPRKFFLAWVSFCLYDKFAGFFSAKHTKHSGDTHGGTSFTSNISFQSRVSLILFKTCFILYWVYYSDFRVISDKSLILKSTQCKRKGVVSFPQLHAWPSCNLSSNLIF